MNTLLKIALMLGVACSMSWTAAADVKFGADRHLARGVTCQSCHGEDMKNPSYPEQETCLKCHPKALLVEKTKGIAAANPHAAPHNGDCTLCHMQHEAPVDYCAQCHRFNFKVK